MTQRPLSNDEILRRVNAVKEHGSQLAAARALGIDEAQIRRAIRHATSRNLDGTWLGGPLPDGYEMGKVTRQYNGDGTIKNEWQRQLPTVEEVERMCDELVEKMGQSITPIDAIQFDLPTIENWLTLYPVVDVHLGQLSWGKESGAPYDLDIAVEQWKSSTAKLFNCSPNSGAGLIVALGDFFHADNDDAQTHKSHNHLDVDGRHDKTMEVGIDLLIWTIDMALQKHAVVYVHVSKGNHDERSASALAVALFHRYHNNPRVIVNKSPKELWTFIWGKVMLAFTHGHRIKAEDMPGVMAAQYAVEWGLTLYRYAYSGHYHKAKMGPRGGDEKHGARWEILPAFTEKDAFNAGSGHTSLREILSITFDKDDGRLFQTSIVVK